jgi:H+/Cl- antiporter ClcA
VLERWKTLGIWLALGSCVGVLCGTASALFLFLLERATELRLSNPKLLYALPLAGFAIGATYQRLGESIRAGNNLVIDTLHEAGPELPLRMAPMVLIGTVLTHLFGGSAGREGTAVQMGASLTDWMSHRLRLPPGLRNQLLAAGVAGGFGSVFGTPVAGAVFGLEWSVLGRLEYAALLPALIASCVGDMTTRALGIQHTVYPQSPQLALSPRLLLAWLAFAAAVALVAYLFIELTHAIKRQAEARVSSLGLRMMLGGFALILLTHLAGTRDYLGLGVPVIVQAFEDPQLAPNAFALKLVFTAITLGSGFLGGEVTPLFFIGATLGNALAPLLDLPLPLAAGVGMAALFAAAANTPLALSIMAIELLGAGAFPHVAVVCGLAYLLSGHRSIYPAQRLALEKVGERLARARPLRDLSEKDEQQAD